MSSKSISRRDILKSLSLGVVAGSVLRAIPLEAAEYAHHMVAAGKGYISERRLHCEILSAAPVRDAARLVPNHDSGGCRCRRSD